LKWSRSLRFEFHEVCGSLVIRGRPAFRPHGGVCGGSSRQTSKVSIRFGPLVGPLGRRVWVLHYPVRPMGRTGWHVVTVSSFQGSGTAGYVTLRVPTLSTPSFNVPAARRACLTNRAPPASGAPTGLPDVV